MLLPGSAEEASAPAQGGPAGIPLLQNGTAAVVRAGQELRPRPELARAGKAHSLSSRCPHSGSQGSGHQFSAQLPPGVESRGARWEGSGLQGERVDKGPAEGARPPKARPGGSQKEGASGKATKYCGDLWRCSKCLGPVGSQCHRAKQRGQGGRKWLLASHSRDGHRLDNQPLARGC